MQKATDSQMVQPLKSIGFDLTGRKILITGAAGGIGAATSQVCSFLGAKLILVDHGEGHESIAPLIQAGHQYESCDIRSRAAVENLCSKVGPVDALVLNAGIFPKEDWLASDWEEQLQDIMAVNFVGAVNFARALLPSMKERVHGRIVLTGSIAAHTGGSHANSPMNYAASKGAIHTFTRWLARRAAPQVMVNAVAPGPVETQMNVATDRAVISTIPAARFAAPEEIAWPIAFLCSSGASYICGAVLDVNGGIFMG